MGKIRMEYIKLKNNIVIAYKEFIKFFRKHNEFLVLPIGILIWVITPYILRWFDATAGSHDIGKLQIFILATVGLFFATASVWILLRVATPEIYEKLDDFLHKYKDELTAWQILKFCFLFFALLLLSYVGILMAIS